MKGTKGLSLCSSDFISFSRSTRQGVVLVTLHTKESHKNVGCLYGQFFRYFIPLSITNKMQRYTIFFIAVDALHVSGGYSAHHQERKLYTQHLVHVKLACCYR